MKKEILYFLASSIIFKVHSRICVGVPEIESIFELYNVWIESTTTTLGFLKLDTHIY